MAPSSWSWRSMKRRRPSTCGHSSWSGPSGTRGAGYGHMPETVPDAEEALRLAGEIRNPRRLAQTLGWVGGLFQWRGEFDRSLECLHRAVEGAGREHAGFVFGQAAFQIGNAYTGK